MPFALIVDHDASYRGALAQVLQAGGYTCTQSASGEAALVAAATLSADVILMDLTSPQTDAGIMLGELARVAPRKRPAIIVLTGGSPEASHPLVTRLGARVLMKSRLALADLREHVADVLLAHELRLAG
jgi:two-component system, NtrC family, response regulator HydG